MRRETRDEKRNETTRKETKKTRRGKIRRDEE